MNNLALTGLVKIEFPAGNLLLCDGGFIVWGADTYLAKDATYGTIGAAEALSEGVGEEVPNFELTLLPPGTTDPADLVQPGIQSSRARFWIAEYDPDTGLVVGTPDLQFDGQVDQCTLEFGRDSYALTLTIVSRVARLLERNIGNSLNPVWHKSIWAGELGHDNGTGLGKNRAWGVEAPKPATAMATGGTSSFSGDAGVIGGGLWGGSMPNDRPSL